jgi:hypothetical protein
VLKLCSLASLAVISGCGLVTQGMHQTVRVTSNPAGADVTFEGETLTTPASVTVSRRSGWRLLRAEKPGFVPGCKVIPCSMNRLVVVFDSIPAAVPLAIDAIFGSLRICPEEVSIELEAERPGVRYAPLPSDDEIWRSFDEENGDLCELHRGSRVLVLPGEPTRAYEILGEVTVNDRDMRKYHVRMSPEGLDRVLRTKAIDMYGGKVDALVPTGGSFEASRLGYSWMRGLHSEGAEGFARALAVHFTGGPRTSADHSLTNRLRDLQEALDAGLISQEEFDRQRTKILEER